MLEADIWQTFPYSRHSSYEELCHFVSVFEPKDVYPCVVEAVTWSPNISVEVLFGRFCSGTSFTHDHEMHLLHEQRMPRVQTPEGSAVNTAGMTTPQNPPVTPVTPSTVSVFSVSLIICILSQPTHVYTQQKPGSNDALHALCLKGSENAIAC